MVSRSTKRTRAAVLLCVLASGCGRAAFDARADAMEERCSEVIAAAMDVLPDNWQLNANARIDAATASAMLTDALPEKGSLFYANRLLVDSIVVEFEFWIGLGDGGDGMGVVFTTDGADAIGDGGGALGMAGLAGFGVELDTYANLDQCVPDIDENHIAIDNLGLCGGPNTGPTVLTQAAITHASLRDEQWHQAAVVIAAGTFTVTVDGLPYIQDFVMPDWVGGEMFVGFVAANGGSQGRHLVRHVRIEIPTACP